MVIHFQPHLDMMSLVASSYLLGLLNNLNQTVIGHLSSPHQQARFPDNPCKPLIGILDSYCQPQLGLLDRR